MEYEELKSLWENYETKLNNLESLNKKLIAETLVKKPQKKLNWFIFQNLYVFITTPIILLVALHEQLRIENIDTLFIIGGILILAVVIYICVKSIKTYLALKKINLQNDTIVESNEKVNNFKKALNNTQSSNLISTITLFLGILFLGWKSFHFGITTILFMAGLLIFTLILGYFSVKKVNNRVEKLEKDILELEEYKK